MGQDILLGLSHQKITDGVNVVTTGDKIWYDLLTQLEPNKYFMDLRWVWLDLG